MKTSNFTFLSEQDQTWRNDIITQLAKEARIPIARAMMTTWSQFEKPNKFRTSTGREVELSKILMSAIYRLPCYGRYVFSMSPFPPTIPDRYLEPARKRLIRRMRLQAVFG